MSSGLSRQHEKSDVSAKSVTGIRRRLLQAFTQLPYIKEATAIKQTAANLGIELGPARLARLAKLHDKRNRKSMHLKTMGFPYRYPCIK